MFAFLWEHVCNESNTMYGILTPQYSKNPIICNFDKQSIRCADDYSPLPQSYSYSWFHHNTAKCDIE